MKKAKKFDSTQVLLGLGIGMIVLVIALALGLQVTGDIQDDMTTDSAEYNATGDGIEGVSNITEKLPIYGTAAISIVLISLFFFFMKRK